MIDWTHVAQPLIDAATYTIAGFLGLAVTGILGRARAYLDARGHAEASRVVADASTRVQAAMQNAAGQIALEIQAGNIDGSDLQAIKDRAVIAADMVRRKVPDALAKLQPVSGAVESAIMGKITAALPPQAAPAPAPVVLSGAAGPDLSNGSFEARAAIVKSRLMKDLDLPDFQSAGIVGNLGQESGLLPINEVRPVGGRGGFGWAQWTGPRRVAFEEWCKRQGLSVTDPEANYGYLIEELRTTEAGALTALRATTTLEEATRVFEERFERAGIAAMDRRVKYAQQALAA